MRKETVICDGCKQEIERYSKYATHSHVEVRPIPYKNDSGSMYLVYFEPEPIQQYCNNCWKKMKKAIIDEK